MSKKQIQEEAKTSFERAVSVRRVTKVTKGGKRFAFSAFVISGDRQGKVGIAIGKGRDVSAAISKATAKASKSRISVPLYGTTVPYSVEGSHGACKVIIQSASKGTGIIAGGPVRAVMESIGVKDILTKSFGSSNNINVVKATLNALAKLRSAKHIAKLRGKTVQQVMRGNNVAAK
ncbi:MAG: 30S ribosomal protein S5 [Epsilonproteobacteria bacterium]|nr:30S ribosomal protein S5 [Campylobacterota bacterium]|tara:strand:+ start:223 stop:750 length:528 start_codon:yes stop_codon:yes gene_type:complete